MEALSFFRPMITSTIVTRAFYCFRSLHSVAKYCAKKLPTSCAVFAVNNGKIEFKRESNIHSGKVSAEVAPCGEDEMYCVVPFRAHQPKDVGEGDTTQDVGTKGSKLEDTIVGEQPVSCLDPVDFSRDQIQIDADPSVKAEESCVEPVELSREQIKIDTDPSVKAEESCMDPVDWSRDQVQIDTDPSAKAEESTAEQKDGIAELPGQGASVLYCVLPARSSDSVASTSSRQDHDSIDLPTEGAGELYCVLPPRNGHSGRSIGDSKRSIVSWKGAKPSNSALEGDGDLYCRLPKNGRSGRSSGGSKRSVGMKGVIRRSSSFSSDIHVNSQTSPSKRDGSVCTAATERSSSTVSTEAEDSPNYSARNAETHLSSPMSLRRMIEGRSDRCHLRRRIFSHHRSSSFEWAKISMVQWAMRLPSRYTSVHPDSKLLKSDASPRLNCDSETESTSAVEPESMFSFAFYDVAWPPSELESLREKYSSVCRLFSYEELKLATSNYSPGNCL